MTTVFEKAYDYLLINNESGWFVTYMSGGVFEIDICIQLLDSEIENVKDNRENLETLIKKFKESPKTYENRRIIPSVWN